jgi:hypothetical protein
MFWYAIICVAFVIFVLLMMAYDRIKYGVLVEISEGNYELHKKND